MPNHVLLESVMTFPLDTARAQPSFLNRLCLATGWKRAHALRVIQEYRRYLYLCAVFPDDLLPSGDVDQVWQLHLCYTQSYWEEYCMKILGRPLHHQPLGESRAERARAYVWYDRARRRYQQEFGEMPPEDIWGEPDRLFGRDREPCERVNLRRYWVFPKPRPLWASTAVALAAVIPWLVASFDWAAVVAMLILAAAGVGISALWTDRAQRSSMARS